MAILVHHLENSRSHRVLWLLEELEVPYELKRYQRNRQRGWRRLSSGRCILSENHR
jgi:glutathione S-transferase